MKVRGSPISRVASLSLGAAAFVLLHTPASSRAEDLQCHVARDGKVLPALSRSQKVEGSEFRRNCYFGVHDREAKIKYSVLLSGDKLNLTLREEGQPQVIKVAHLDENRTQAVAQMGEGNKALALSCRVLP